ncbi:MAG: hypothetical protein WCI91_03465 [Candidatus Nomurabacteria bacterium]
MKKLLYFIFIFCIFFVPSLSRAEVEIGITENDINIDMYPEKPQPYQDTKITLSSYATDLNKAMIEWRSGNKIILSGYGKTTYSFKTQGPNTSTSFVVTIMTSDTRDRLTKSFTINPSEVEILWESVDGYTPLFYKGKSLVSSEGLIRAVAIPNTNTIKSGRGDISYTWKKSDKTNLDVSGYNKDSYTFYGSVLNDSEKVSVKASSVDGSYDAEGKTEIPTYDPEIIFYNKSPTEGIQYQNALTENSPFPGNEMTLVAEPYFLALKNNEKNFTYDWTINGDSVTTPLNKRELTVSPTSRGGYASIMLTLENINKLFQKVTGQLKLSL